MVENFKQGGAAINQLCDLSNIALSVIPINLDKPTKDFSEEKAMHHVEPQRSSKRAFCLQQKQCTPCHTKQGVKCCLRE